MIYFTSDQHLGHPAIISMQKRPFRDVGDMNRTIINNFNSMVHKDDTVSLNGRCFALMHYPMLSWPKSNHGSYQLHGHIHAKKDYNLQNRLDAVRRYDVGVDANNFYPVSVEQIICFFEDM